MAVSDLGDHDTFGLAKLIYTRECSKAVDELTNVVQFQADGEEFALASGFGLTDGNETFLSSCRVRWIASSGTNEGGQGWGVRRDVEMKGILWPFLYGATACKGSTENSAMGHHQMHD